MRINHLIIGAFDLDHSARFYQELLGFTVIETFVDSGTGTTGKIARSPASEGGILDLLFVTFTSHRLPNPQHLAIELAKDEFEKALLKARALGLKIRPNPELDSPAGEPGVILSQGAKYTNFYIVDPASVNLEIMARI